MTSYTLIGLMSGTSMDGVDLAHCRFQKSAGTWEFSVLQTHTFPYPDSILENLVRSKELSGLELTLLDTQLGRYFSECILEFAKNKGVDLSKIDAIASHGHTIFHQPEKGFTLQIGCGETLAALTGVKVINDFRKKDVLAGGQGAPLVPIGDQLLFASQASAFLNIGGFANVCLLEPEIRAFDVCPGNLPLNFLAQKRGQHFDREGEIARSGHVNHDLLRQLNEIEFYHKIGPKSLGTEWLDAQFLPLLAEQISLEDQMRTCVEHIAYQVSRNLSGSASLMITGGGAKNSFLVERIQSLYEGKIILPDEAIIDFKEALIFAFLGALFLNEDPNCLATVTGARKDVCGGILHLP